VKSSNTGSAEPTLAPSETKVQHFNFQLPTIGGMDELMGVMDGCKTWISFACSVLGVRED